MVLYYLLSRDLKKIEGNQFTLRPRRTARIRCESPMKPLCLTSYRRFEARIPGVTVGDGSRLLPEELARTLESTVNKSKLNTTAIGQPLLVMKGYGESRCIGVPI